MRVGDTGKGRQGNRQEKRGKGQEARGENLTLQAKYTKLPSRIRTALLPFAVEVLGDIFS